MEKKHQRKTNNVMCVYGIYTFDLWNIYLDQIEIVEVLAFYALRNILCSFSRSHIPSSIRSISKRGAIRRMQSKIKLSSASWWYSNIRGEFQSCIELNQIIDSYFVLSSCDFSLQPATIL